MNRLHPIKLEGQDPYRSDLEEMLMLGDSRNETDLAQWVGSNAGTFAMVFTDVVNSTKIAIEVGSYAMEQVKSAHIDMAKHLISNRNGFFIGDTGDGTIAVFYTVVAALDFARTFYYQTGDIRVRIRIGIHVGQLNLNEDMEPYGTIFNYTKRIMEMLNGPGICISQSAMSLLEEIKAPHHASLLWVNHKTELKDFGSSSVYTTRKI